MPDIYVRMGSENTGVIVRDGLLLTVDRGIAGTLPDKFIHIGDENTAVRVRDGALVTCDSTFRGVLGDQFAHIGEEHNALTVRDGCIVAGTPIGAPSVYIHLRIDHFVYVLTLQNGALVSGYISSISYANNVKAIPNMIAYLPLTELTGTTASDASGHSVVGTATNVTWANADGAGPTMGKAPLFGATSFINIAAAAFNAAGYNGQEFTMGIWLKNPGWAVTQTITMLQTDTDGSNRNFIRQVGALTLAWFEQAGGTILNASTSSGLNAGWLHALFTVSLAGNAKKNYLNGLQVGATQTPVGTYAGVAVSVNIGRRDGGENWIGHLGHAVFYARALTAAEALIVGTPV